MSEGNSRFRGAHIYDESLTQPDAPLRHAEKESRTQKRDRFGNRAFASSELAYRDREGKETKSALLVSQAGERFLKENSGILHELDRALKMEMEKTRDARFKESHDLGSGRSLQYLGSGGQSV